MNWHSGKGCGQVLLYYIYTISGIFVFVVFVEAPPIPEESRKKKSVTYEELRNKHRETYEVMSPLKAETAGKFPQERPVKEGTVLIYTNTW